MPLTLSHGGGCLVECAAGTLTAEEKEKVQVMTLQNYTPSSSMQISKLSLVLADRNNIVQRAIVSHLVTGAACLIQLGGCVHCAIRHISMLHAYGIKITVLLD